MTDFHDWKTAADKKRDQIFRHIFEIEKYAKKIDIDPVEELSLDELTEDDCRKDTDKIKPPTSSGGFILLDD